MRELTPTRDLIGPNNTANFNRIFDEKNLCGDALFCNLIYINNTCKFVNTVLTIQLVKFFKKTMQLRLLSL